MHTQKKTHELTFDFERLVVYQRTLELITLVVPLLDNPPKRAAKPCEDTSTRKPQMRTQDERG